MQPILVLWATPRSTSTAFEWMMRMRGDMRCFHEPFGEAWYQGEDARWPRIRPDSPRTPGLTFESVWQTLRAAADNGPQAVQQTTRIDLLITPVKRSAQPTFSYCIRCLVDRRALADGTLWQEDFTEKVIKPGEPMAAGCYPTCQRLLPLSALAGQFFDRLSSI